MLAGILDGGRARYEPTQPASIALVERVHTQLFHDVLYLARSLGFSTRCCRLKEKNVDESDNRSIG